MKRYLFLTALFVLAPKLPAYDVPFIVLSCYLDPSVPASNLSNGVYTGYDCVRSHDVKAAVATIDNSISPRSIEYIQELDEQMSQVYHSSEDRCGRNCRFFYAAVGKQCLAVAQSRLFTGVGTFTSGATTQQEANKIAMQNCVRYVGEPNVASCQLVASVCHP